MEKKSSPKTGTRALFMRNKGDEVAIAFMDPAWIRSDIVLVDKEDGSVHAVLHESLYFIDHLPPHMLDSFKSQDTVLLTAPHPEGGFVDLVAPLQMIPETSEKTVCGGKS